MATIAVLLSVVFALIIYEKLDDEDASCIHFNLKQILVVDIVLLCSNLTVFYQEYYVF